MHPIQWHCSALKLTHQHFDVLLGELVQGVALLLEDLDVGGQQVLPLHPLPSRHRADQESGVDVPSVTASQLNTVTILAITWVVGVSV